MSTNYFAHLAIKGDDVTNRVRLHLGKTSSGTVIVDSNVFPSFKAMVAFLTTTNATVTIVDEYDRELDLEDFTARFYQYTEQERARQHNYIQGNPIAAKNTTLDDEGFTLSPGAWF